MPFVDLTVLTSPRPQTARFEPSFYRRDSKRGCTSEGRKRALRAGEEETPIGKKARSKSGLLRGNTRGTPLPNLCCAPASAPGTRAPPRAQMPAGPAGPSPSRTPGARAGGTGAGAVGAGLGASGPGPGGRVGGGSLTGLPSSADFMVPPAGGAGPKVSPLPQPAAGEPSGNLEGTGKLVLGIHAAAAARNRRRSGHRRGRAPGKLTPRRTRAAWAQRRAPRRNVIQGRVAERLRPGTQAAWQWQG